MPLDPAVITAVGGALAATIGAIVGGKKGGENSLNGFKEEVRTGFTGVHTKLDALTKTDGVHEARLESIERIVDRRIKDEEVVLERREG